MFETIASLLGGGLWAIIKAVLVLILAFIVAAVVRSLVVKLLSKTKLSALLGKADSSSGGNDAIVNFVGKLVYLIVFLLFVPGIFESLGMTGVSSPILNLLNTLWGYLPNILAAGLVLWVGFFIAKLARELLVPVFGKLKVNTLQEKAGIQVSDSAKLSNTLAYVVYVLILIPVIIAALQVLDIQAVSAPAIRMLETLFQFIPNVLAALVIVVLGCMIAKFAGNIVENLIASAGLDAKLTEHLENKNNSFVLSKVIGTVIHTIIVVFFVVESFGVLRLDVLTGIGNAVIQYMPYVLAAALILLACYVCNGFVQKALQKSGHTGLALVIKFAIYIIGVFMVLNELGIAKEIVNTAFILIVAALAVAFAISFGLGGRDFAGKAMKKLEDTCGIDQDKEN